MMSSVRSVLLFAIAAIIIAAAAGVAYGLEALPPSRIRPLNGVGNNVANPQFGAFRAGFIRQPDTTPHYADGIDIPAGADRPSPRNVSRAIFPYDKSKFTSHLASGMMQAWGQFLVHELLWTQENQTAAGLLPIPVPNCDAVLDPTCTGTATIPFRRVIRKGGVMSNPVENEQTAWFDGSGIYGWAGPRMALMREFVGGRVKMNKNAQFGDMLPFNLANAQVFTQPGLNITTQFLSGDVRVNENAYMMMLHTLFRREHNRRVAYYASLNATLNDEQLFQLGRNWVTALISQITYVEYLPLLLGQQMTPVYNDSSYNTTIDPGIDVFFWTAAFRYGHSDSNDLMLRLDETRNPSSDGHLNLRDTPLRPEVILNGGIDTLLRGCPVMPLQEIDTIIQDDVRGAFVPDLVAVNIQRGREVGAPNYNQARVAFGLPRVTSFADDGTWIPGAADALIAAYGVDGIDRVDGWVGGLLETPNGGILGPLFQASIYNQFIRLRDGDRFWYQRTGQMASSDELIELQTQYNLAAVVLKNTNITAFPVRPFRNQLLAVASAATASAANGRVQFFSDYQFAWNLDDTHFNGKMIVGSMEPGVGFAGIGFGKQSMSDVDIVLCRLSDENTPICEDSWSHFFHPYPDSDFGGINNIAPSDVSVVFDAAKGQHTFTWRRPLLTGDRFDQQFRESDGMISIIFAHSYRSGVVYHELPNRSFGSINFFTGAVAGFATDEDFKTRVSHGISMSATWLLLYPAGVFVARYMKHNDWWIYVHQKLQEFGVLNVFAFALMAWLTTPVEDTRAFISPHSYIAIILLGMLATQIVLGYTVKYRLTNDTRKLYSARKRAAHAGDAGDGCCSVFGDVLFAYIVRLSKYHAHFGYAMLFLAPVQAWYGLNFLFPTDERYKTALYIWCATLIFLFLVYEFNKVVTEYRARQAMDAESAKLQAGAGSAAAPLLGELEYDWHEIAQRVQSGGSWLVIRGLVYDVAKWMDSHPGGQTLLQDCIGTDCSHEFYGESVDGDAEKRHYRHSSLAVKKLASLRVGRLRMEAGGGAAGGMDDAATAGKSKFALQQNSEYRHFRLIERELLTPAPVPVVAAATGIAPPPAALPVYRFRFILVPRQFHPKGAAAAVAAAGLQRVVTHPQASPAPPSHPPANGDHKHAPVLAPASPRASPPPPQLLAPPFATPGPAPARDRASTELASFNLDFKKSEIGASAGGSGADAPLPMFSARGSVIFPAGIAAALNGEKSFMVVAGQHVVAQMISDGGDGRRIVLERSYTPWPEWGTGRGAAADHKAAPANSFDLVVKVYPKGPMSQMMAKLMIGDKLKFRGPVGVSLLNPSHPSGIWSHLTLIAAGTGITPMAQLAHAHLVYNKGLNANPTAAAHGLGPAQIELISFNRTQTDIIVPEVWERHAAMSGGHFTVSQVLTQPNGKWSGLVGRPSVPLFQQLIKAIPASAATATAAVAVTDTPLTTSPAPVPSPSPVPSSPARSRPIEKTSRIVVCGPRGFTKSVAAILESMGYSDEIIVYL